MRKLRHLLRQSGLLDRANRRRDSGRGGRSNSTQRRLGNEALEKRELLAGDIASSALHNTWNPYDVNNDLQISALDALGVVNHLNQSGEGENIGGGDAANEFLFLDVNADNRVSAADALGVINALGRGEAVGEIVELILTARDTNDTALTPDGNGDINVDVGEKFYLEVSYDDLRVNGFTIEEQGIFQLLTDLSVNQPDVLAPVLNEVQRIRLDNAVTSATDATFVFSIPELPPGVASGNLSFSADFATFASNQTGTISQALQSFGYTTDQYQIAPWIAPDDDFGYEIHWTAEEFGNVDLPNITLQVLAGTAVSSSTIDFGPFLGDGVTPNPETVRFNIDFNSRTFDNDPFYGTLLSYGDFTLQDGFKRTGGVGLIVSGVPEAIAVNGTTFPQPFDSYSLPVYLKSAVTDLEVTVGPAVGEAEAVLVYGNGIPDGTDSGDPRIPSDLILVETTDTNNNGEAGIVSGIGVVTINGTLNSPGVLAFDPASVTVDEDAGVASLTVSRTDGSVGPVSVTYATVAGTAAETSDFSSASGTLQFADGETSKTLVVPIINDGDVESTESFTVVLSNPLGGATLGTASTATVTINDNDVVLPGVLSLSVSTTNVNEDAGSVNLTVERTGGSDGAVSVDFATANGTAVSGADYTSNSGTLSFADGETSKVITIAVLNDSDFEGNETFTVTLSNVSGGATIGTGQTTVTIIDDDVFTPGVIAFNSATASVNEDAGNVTLTVARTGGSDGAVTAAFTTVAGTATEGTDFTANSGTVEFADGETSKTIVVAIINDSDIDPNEIFTVVLSNPTGQATLGANSTITVSIVDDENPGTLAFSAATASVNEDEGTVTLTVERKIGTDGVVTVAYATSNGTAVAGQDYTSNSGTLTFQPGESSKDIVLNIIDDTDIESNETLTVTLSDPTGGAVLGSPAVTTVTIIEDDVPGTLAFQAATANVDEDGGSIEIIVSRTNGSDGEVTVAYATSNGTAVAGQDYTDQSGVLTFGNGVLSQAITIPILDNSVINDDKVFSVNLSSAGGGALLGTPNSINITIREDDVELSFDPSSISVNENAGTASLIVKRAGDADAAVTADFNTQDVTAFAGTDYIANSGTVTFGTGVLSQTITVDITDDNSDESNESFNVNLSNPSGATIGAAGTAEVTITDDDVAGTLSIDASATVTEKDGSVTLTVTRANGSDGEITVKYATSDGTAIAGQDYTATQGTLTFAHDDLTKEIQVFVTDDSLGSESDETFNVDLTDPTGGAVLGTARSVVTIQNVNEGPEVDGPVIVTPRSEQDAIFSVSEADLLFGATDREGDGLTVSNLVLSLGDGRGVTVVNENSLTVDPDAYGYLGAAQTAEIEYTYSISDGSNSVTQTVKLTITGFNDPPDANDDLNVIAFKGATSNIRVLDNDTAGDGESQILTITAATSVNGQVVIKTDGTLDFTPDPGFLGSTTIEYTIQDEEGKTADATVFVEVKDFLPSSISGHVFIDEVENLASDIAAGEEPIRDGLKDADEQGLMGVLVSLFAAAADNVTGQEVQDTTLTDSDGLFSFGDLAPGTYTISYAATDSVLFIGEPDLLREIPANGGVDFEQVNFPLLSLTGQTDILASSYFYRDGGLVSLDDTGQQEFVTSLDGFAENVKFVEFGLGTQRDTALLTIVEEDGDVMTAKLSGNEFRLFGDAAFFFTAQTDLTFLTETELNSLAGNYPGYRDAVDQVLADM